MAGVFKSIGDGLYKNGSLFYERIRHRLPDGNRRDEFKLIPASNKDEARTIRARRIIQYKQFMEGIPDASDPYVDKVPAPQKRKVTMEELFQEYEDSGCPTKRSRMLEGKKLEWEKHRLGMIRSWPGWKGVEPPTIRQSTLDNYEAWRRSKATKRFKNGRILDLEIRLTLMNVLRLAVRRDLIPSNPLAHMEISRCQDTKTIRYAKDCRPEDADELHHIGDILFADHASESLGFQMFMEALTGIRTSEALALRWDARPFQPGHIDGDVLHLGRAKKGINPWANIHPALKSLLDALREWHDLRFPESVWFFPSYRDPGKHADPTSLAHALQRIAAESHGQPRTSHGLRAFYVGVRRSEFILDAVIAAEIGDKTGASIIEKHYGPLPPNWLTTKAGKLTWLAANRKPAWELFLEQLRAKAKAPANVIHLKKAG